MDSNPTLVNSYSQPLKSMQFRFLKMLIGGIVLELTKEFKTSHMSSIMTEAQIYQVAIISFSEK